MKMRTLMSVVLVAGIASAMEGIGLDGLWDFRFERGKPLEEEEYTRTMLEEMFAQKDIAGVAIWQFTDCKTYTRTKGMRNRSYGVNTGGLNDLYRRPKLAVEAVREQFRKKAK